MVGYVQLEIFAQLPALRVQVRYMRQQAGNDVIKESLSKINAKTLINPIHSINLSQFI